MKKQSFKQLLTLVLAALIIAAIGCSPLFNQNRADSEGKFMVSDSRVFDTDSAFDIRDELVYPRPDRFFSPSLNVSNKELTLGTDTTLGRCNRCHDCGFEEAWDTQNYLKEDWSPRYRGDEWQQSLQRMRYMDNSMINEQIADRLFSFLREETLGEYDEDADPRGAHIVEVEEPRVQGGSLPSKPEPIGQY